MSGRVGPPVGQAADDGRAQRVSLRSSDVEQVRAFGGRYFFPRKFLHPLHRSGRLAARFDILRLGPVTICDARYGGDVTLGYEHPDAYQIGVPLVGRLEAHQGGRAILSVGNLAAVSRVGEDVVIDCWSADCRQLVAKIERDVLERQLQHLLDAPLQVPIKLAGQLDITAGLGRSWAALIRLVTGEFSNESGMFDHPLIVGHLHEALTIGLLMATDHPYREALTRPGHAYRPPPVRRAIEAIHAYPEHPFTIATLADTAGVSVRCLQAGFRRYVGSTPMAYLRKVRLARAHEDLRAADPGQTTVAQVAHRWGFVHLGRFAAAYRALYHTTPSQTLGASDSSNRPPTVTTS
jgi:AraC-like DNA-binding protein